MSLATAPIIHTNTGFQSMTGYGLEEMVGRSCRFLQGPKTDPSSVAVIKEAMSTGSPCHVRMLNYRKDGTMFNNMLTFRPIFDSEGHMVFGVSINIEVVDSFGRLKPLLTQVDRLNKLLPEKIPLPSPPSVRERVSVVNTGMLDNRAEQRGRLANAATDSTKEEIPRSTLMTATEKATTLAKERAAEYQKKERAGREVAANVEGKAGAAAKSPLQRQSSVARHHQSGSLSPPTKLERSQSPRQPNSARSPPMMQQRPSSARLQGGKSESNLRAAAAHSRPATARTTMALARDPSTSAVAKGGSAPLPRRSPSSGVNLPPMVQVGSPDLSRRAALPGAQRSPRTPRSDGEARPATAATQLGSQRSPRTPGNSGTRPLATAGNHPVPPSVAATNSPLSPRASRMGARPSTGRLAGAQRPA